MDHIAIPQKKPANRRAQDGCPVISLKSLVGSTVAQLHLGGVKEKHQWKSGLAFLAIYRGEQGKILTPNFFQDRQEGATLLRFA